MLAETRTVPRPGCKKRVSSSERLLLSLRCHLITMVQPAESRKGLNLAFTCRANFCCTTSWRVLRQSKMSPVLMVIEQVGKHQSFEMPLIEDDHVVQQVASATSYPALSNTVLPRTAKSRASWLASHVSHGRNHIGAKLGVSVEEQESVRLLVRTCFSQLLYYPKCMRIARHIEVQDLTPAVADNEKAVQNTERERWDGEEVHRRNGLTVVSEERQPSLCRIWISRGAPDPSRDTPFRDIETQHEQFAVNARRSPVGFS